MDEMKIVSKFTRWVSSEIIEFIIYKKTGYKTSIDLNEFNATVVDGKVHIHLSADAEIEKDELTKILKDKLV